MASRVSGEKGLTLVELIVTVAILGVIMVPISLMLYVGYQSSFNENELVTANEQARSAINMMMNDLRAYDFASSSYDENGVLIKHVNNNQLVIKNDLVYSYDGQGNIKKNGEIICQQVKNFSVSEYYDGTNSNIVEISLAVQPRYIGRPASPIELKESYWRRVPVNK